jgi:centrosomal protein CEP290
LKDGKGAAKVIEWHKRIEEIRLKDLKLNRNITKLHEQIKFLESLNKSQEHSLVRLEEENVRMAKVSRMNIWDDTCSTVDRVYDQGVCTTVGFGQQGCNGEQTIKFILLLYV